MAGPLGVKNIVESVLTVKMEDLSGEHLYPVHICALFVLPVAVVMIQSPQRRPVDLAGRVAGACT
jgi:hypothetical protein